jgi:hypothetical protein
MLQAQHVTAMIKARKFEKAPQPREVGKVTLTSDGDV